MNASKTTYWSRKKLLGFTLLSVSLFFLFIEIIFRIACWYQWQPYHTNLEIQGSPRLISDSFLTWNNRPFYLEYNNESQHNELGMRVEAGNVFMPEKTEQDFWVFLLGGSAMAGMGSNINGEWLDITHVHNHTISTSIDGYLEKILQEQFPHKKVKVFNAAITSATIFQSYRNYVRLKQYKPDWVVTMDGANEPKTFEKGQTVSQYIQEEWEKDPSINPPISYYTTITKHSAFLNALKKWFFFFRLKSRIFTGENNSEIQQKWIHKNPLPLIYNTSDKQIHNAIDSFLYQMEFFRNTLIHNKQKYLMLIQPHLSLRDTTKIKDIEKGVYNYYSACENSTNNQYYKLLYENAAKIYARDSSIFVMNFLHTWHPWVFVDYCHFTDEANEKIAAEIGNFILSDGSIIPFREKN